MNTTGITASYYPYSSSTHNRSFVRHAKERDAAAQHRKTHSWTANEKDCSMGGGEKEEDRRASSSSPMVGIPLAPTQSTSSSSSSDGVDDDTSDEETTPKNDTNMMQEEEEDVPDPSLVVYDDDEEPDTTTNSNNNDPCADEDEYYGDPSLIVQDDDDDEEKDKDQNGNTNTNESSVLTGPNPHNNNDNNNNDATALLLASFSEHAHIDSSFDNNNNHPNNQSIDTLALLNLSQAPEHFSLPPPSLLLPVVRINTEEDDNDKNILFVDTEDRDDSPTTDTTHDDTSPLLLVPTTLGMANSVAGATVTLMVDSTNTTTKEDDADAKGNDSREEEEEEEVRTNNNDTSMFYPMHNTSISTYAAMNISQATVPMPPPGAVVVADDDAEEEDVATDLLALASSTIVVESAAAASTIAAAGGETSFATLSCCPAMEWSRSAMHVWQTEHNVALALELFQKAADWYCNPNDSNNNNNTTKKTSILNLVNAAGCYRNMSVVSQQSTKQKKGQNSNDNNVIAVENDAASYLRRSEELYVTAREAVEVKAASQAIVTLDGQRLLDDSYCNQSTATKSQNYNNNKNNVSTASGLTTLFDDESLSLDGMILETLCSRASFHVKFQDAEQAVECYEQCLKQLIHLNKLHLWEEEDDEDDPEALVVREEGVTFIPLSKEKHTQFLIQSLESLGALYRTMARGSAYSACLVLYEDALDTLQSRQEKEEPHSDILIGSVAQILRYLSEIYFERQELDRAVDALHDSTAVQLTASGEPNREALQVMDKMGAANEKMEQWEKALSCYEQTLFARCKFYGNTHTCVAKSLVNVARVMERKNNGRSTDESVELYKAANAIFALSAVSDSPDLGQNVEAILQLIPTVIRQGRYEKAVADLNRCLALADDPDFLLMGNQNNGDATSSLHLDKAQMYFDLGRAYMGMNNHEMATSSLLKAIQQVGNVPEEAVYTLVQRVEFMQQQQHHNSSKSLDVAMRTTMDGREVSVQFEDPTLSFRDITFQLQGEPSVYIFEDETSVGKQLQTSIDDNDVEETIHHSLKNHSYDILYESFTHEPLPQLSKEATARSKDQRLSLGNALRARLASPSRQLKPTQDASPSPMRAKISKKVAHILQRLKESKSMGQLSSKCKSTSNKIKKIGKKCFKMCQGKPQVVVPEGPIVAKAADESILAKFENLSAATTDKTIVVTAANNTVVRSRRMAVRNVVIEEKEEGFESNLINTSNLMNNSVISS